MPTGTPTQRKQYAVPQEPQIHCDQRLPALSHSGHLLLGFAAKQPTDLLIQTTRAPILHLVGPISILGHVFAGP